MYPELTNLLPPERRRAAKRDYFFRVATVAISALTCVVVGSGVLLIPSYLYVNQQIQVSQARSKDIDTQLASIKGQEASTRMATISGDADYLTRLSGIPTASAVFRAVLGVPRAGITLTGFTFTPPQTKDDGKMTLTGIASTREALRTYNDALTALPFVSNVDLPISSYAKDSVIPFTITLTGTLTP